MVRQLVERGEMWPTQRQYVAFSEAKSGPQRGRSHTARATGATSCEVFGKKRLELVKF